MSAIENAWTRFTTLDTQTVSRDIPAPASTVYGVFEDHRRLFALFGELGLEVSSDRPSLERGNLYDFSPAAGVHIKVYAQEVEVNRRVDLIFLTGPVKGSWRLSMDPLDGEGCRLSLKFDMHTRNPLFRFIWWIFLYRLHCDSARRILEWADGESREVETSGAGPAGT